MGRKKIDWVSLDYKDYPLKNLLGKERRLQRMIEKRQGDIQKLQDTIKRDLQKINRDIINIKGDLSNIRKVIQEKSKEVTNKGIYVLRGDKITRGKVRMMGESKWVHIGSNDVIDKFTNTGKTYGKMTDEELIKIIKIKLGKTLTQFKIG